MNEKTCDVTQAEVTSEFYEVNEKDEYASVGDVLIEANVNDYDFPVSISAETADGRDIGIVLCRKDLRRLVAEAWFAGVVQF
jgi:hypothetical protein